MRKFYFKSSKFFGDTKTNGCLCACQLRSHKDIRIVPEFSRKFAIDPGKDLGYLLGGPHTLSWVRALECLFWGKKKNLPKIVDHGKKTK